METLIEEVPTLETANTARLYGTMIGRGAYRSVFHMSGSKWVYKFEDEEPIDDGVNRREIFNHNRLKGNLPEGVAMPDMVLLSEEVLAAEYIDGIIAADIFHSRGDFYRQDQDVCACPSHGLVECYNMLLRKMTVYISDLHGRNVIVSRSRGKVFIIDMGEYGDGTA